MLLEDKDQMCHVLQGLLHKPSLRREDMLQEDKDQMCHVLQGPLQNPSLQREDMLLEDKDQMCHILQDLLLDKEGQKHYKESAAVVLLPCL